MKQVGLMNLDLTIAASTPDISVIVPTTCEASRREFIERAIESVLSQGGITLELIIVVNGNRFDADLLHRLRQNKNIRVIQLSNGNVSRARFDGVCQARGRLFCFLDDDDEFLENALQIRVERMREMPNTDVVVTNGFIRESNDYPMVSEKMAQQIKDDLPASIFTTNWFASAASTFRKSTIDESMFNFKYKYFEWTFLFFALVARKMTVDYIHVHTYRKYENNPLSVSKSDAYILACPAVLLDLMCLSLSDPLKAGLKRKLCSSLNAVSKLHVRNKNISQAWATHLRCVLCGGWRYVPYTMILLRASFCSGSLPAATPPGTK